MRHHFGKGGFHIDASAHGREVMHCNTKLLAQAGAGKAVLAQLWGCKRTFLLPIAKAQLRHKLLFTAVTAKVEKVQIPDIGSRWHTSARKVPANCLESTPIQLCFQRLFKRRAPISPGFKKRG